MNIEEKIARLSNLFRQRDAIEQQIKDLINDEEIGILIGGKRVEIAFETPKKKGRKPRTEKPTKEKRPYNKKESKIQRYHCQECGTYFHSSETLLNVACSDCSSIHIKKAID